jgi:hypothetical protein
MPFIAVGQRKRIRPPGDAPARPLQPSRGNLKGSITAEEGAKGKGNCEENENCRVLAMNWQGAMATKFPPGWIDGRKPAITGPYQLARNCYHTRLHTTLCIATFRLSGGWSDV